MASLLTSATSDTTGSSVAATAAKTVTVSGTLKQPAKVWIEYSTDDSTWVKTGLQFGSTGVADLDLNSGAGFYRAVLKDTAVLDDQASTNVSVDLS